MGGVVGNIGILRSEILRQAQEQAKSTLERAKRVSERDLVYAQQEADEIKSQQRDAIQPMAEMERKKTLVTAEMEARRRLLEKKEELVSRIFTEAESKLEEMRGSKAYVDIISTLVKDGIASINGDAIVEFGEKDKAIFTQKFKSAIESQLSGSLNMQMKLDFRCVGDAISSGVLVRSKNGKIVIDNSFSGRLRRLKEDLRGEVSEILLEESDKTESGDC